PGFPLGSDSRTGTNIAGTPLTQVDPHEGPTHARRRIAIRALPAPRGRMSGCCLYILGRRSADDAVADGASLAPPGRRLRGKHFAVLPAQCGRSVSHAAATATPAQGRQR